MVEYGRIVNHLIAKILEEFLSLALLLRKLAQTAARRGYNQTFKRCDTVATVSFPVRALVRGKPEHVAVTWSAGPPHTQTCTTLTL